METGLSIFIASVILLSFLTAVAQFVTIIALLGILTALGVVCGKDEKDETTDLDEVALIEEYVPQVEEPRAELQELPIETIEGIGTQYGKRFRDAGVKTVADLVKLMADKVAEIAGVDIEKAQGWLAMSRFCWLESISEEDAEAIVYGGGIMDLEELSRTDADVLLNRIQEAVKLRHVRIPDGYTFTIEMVKAWIAEAQTKLK